MNIEHDPRRDPETTRLLVRLEADRFFLAVFLAMALILLAVCYG